LLQRGRAGERATGGHATGDRSQDALRGRPRRLAQDVAVGRVDAEREGGQSVGEQVDEQDLEIVSGACRPTAIATAKTSTSPVLAASRKRTKRILPALLGFVPLRRP
jgi:hypothetical protein